MLWIEPYKPERKNKICKECYYWEERTKGWGTCTHPKCSTGIFNYKGYKYKHTTSRYYLHVACKTRFVPKDT